MSFASSRSRNVKIVVLLVIAAAIWLGVRVVESGREITLASGPGTDARPLVVIMDSPHPVRVYDEVTLAAGNTNAHVLSEVLSELSIDRRVEAITPDWGRDQAILAMDPDLIVIHYSGFREEDGSGPRERLRQLIGYFAEANTLFLVYSRAEGPALRQNMEELLAGLASEHPGLLDRIIVFGLDDHGPRSWLSPLTSEALRQAVQEILAL